MNILPPSKPSSRFPIRDKPCWEDEDKAYFVVKEPKLLGETEISALPVRRLSLLHVRFNLGHPGGCSESFPANQLPCTSLEQAGPALQAAVPALAAELELALQDPEADRVPQRLRQPRLPPAQPLLLAGQLEQLALLHVPLPRGRAPRGAQRGEVGQSFFPGQAGRREAGEAVSYGRHPWDHSRSRWTGALSHPEVSLPMAQGGL